MKPLPRILMTLAIAAVGTVVLNAAGFPLPFLFGPMFACLFAALLGAPLKGMGPVAAAARTVIGVTVGAGLTPDTVARVPSMAASVALIPIYVALIGLIGVPFFRRVCGYDAPTAWYAAMPGGLQDMVSFGTEAGGNPRALSLIHATRVLVTLTIAPIVMTHAFGADLTSPMGQAASSIPLHELALMVAAALIGWKGGERIGLFGATILGPLVLTGALSLAGLIQHRPPAEAIMAAQYMLGITIGVGYVGVTLRELRRDVAAGVAFVFILAALAAVFTEIVVLFGLAPPVDGFLAFAPGGQGEMTILAIVAGADLSYVVVHHLTRVFLVITCAPIAARLVGAGNGKPRGGGGP